VSAVVVTRPRVLLADDQPGNSAVVRELLQSEFEVISVVQDGQALIEAAERLTPDVIVTDIEMPLLDGFSAAQVILQHDPSARIVFLTVYADSALVRRSQAIGGLGYVPKVSAGDELLPAVWAAFRGERWCLCKS
jgi:DNA-binding NarL/FixJ family response regulator